MKTRPELLHNSLHKQGVVRLLTGKVKTLL